ncbi:MAG: ATP-binding cassette domain-containing protein, partial [Acidimicrobiia bacterium]
MSNLHKSYGDVQALKGVDFSVEPGEIVALLGHNGAGKTTLVSIVAGLRRPDSGTVH